MGKVLILAGAPDLATLDWEAGDLLEDFTGCFPRFARWADDDVVDDDDARPDHPVWRVVPPERRHGGDLTAEGGQEAGQPASQILRAFPDTPPVPLGRAEFFTTQTASFVSDDSAGTSLTSSELLSFRAPQPLPEESKLDVSRVPSSIPGGEEPFDSVVSQFLEYSLAVHNELPSSLPDLSDILDTSTSLEKGKEQTDRRGQGNQPKGAGPSGQTPNATMSNSDRHLFGDSFGDSFQDSLDASSLPATTLPQPPANWGPLTALCDIPSAAYLNSITPQTATANLVVGIVSVAPPRTVRTRWGGSSTLVEVVVGDETRAGFAVTFWVDAPGETGQVLSSLQPQDVVLFRHVALHVFGERVYGSSLRKDQTKIHVLYRGGLSADADDDGLYTARHLAVAAAEARRKQPAQGTTGPPIDALVAKAALVWEWALRYVVVAEGKQGGSQAGRPRRTWDMPPEDTQE